jgi:divalent metal cation (Fe/Co/Zn/Cd) transporter
LTGGRGPGQVHRLKQSTQRAAAGQLVADVTIAVDGSLSVERAHELADAVESAIESAFGPTEVTLRVEPS